MDDKELYEKAKEAYYEGNPIMSDAEFDELESKVGVGNVGAPDKDAKFKHPSRMLSLSKIQADKTTGAAPSEQAVEWMRSTISKYMKIAGVEGEAPDMFEVTCKYDGNSANCIYKDGKLWKVLSRGDGEYGRDITSKVMHLIPNEIDGAHSVVEVRGEVIMRKDVFKEKYEGRFANPRNLVAGILGRDDNMMSEDLSFIAYEAKIDGMPESVGYVESCGFNKMNHPYLSTFRCNTDDFDKLFGRMVEIRENSEFPLDGFVLKTIVPMRKYLGENDHDPEWAKAIKFKPVGVTTTINNIEWNMGKTGKLTPVAVLEPVDLDGSTVSRVSLNNAGFVEKNDVKIGTRVRIVKSGDIIPQIVEIFK